MFLTFFLAPALDLDPDTLNEDEDEEDSEEGEGWRRGDLEPTVIPDGPEFTVPDEEKSPLEYFLHYFDDEILDLIMAETNRYSAQKSGKSINITKEEIKSFFGVWIYMGVCSLPARSDYWAGTTKVPQVAETMTRNRFKSIFANMHFHDNESESEDRLIKVRPLLNHMRHKCQVLEQEKELSIDERMQRYKGTFAGSIRQYMPDKPSAKWGFKLFVLAGRSGITYDFIPYCGINTFADENLSREEEKMGVGASAVISLCKCIQNPSNSTLTFDNWYTGIPLVTYLRNNMQIYSLGTIKRNRIPECPLTIAKTFEKEKRGTYETFVNKNAVIVMQWNDNKCVTLAGTLVGAEPVSTIKRYCKEAKCKMDVPCPQGVLTYNKTMGGVDLSDMFMALYAVPTRARRWYISLVGYTVELALTNSWLSYKRDCDLLGQKLKVPDSKHFRLEVSLGLMASAQRSKGRPSLDKSLSKKKIVRPMVPRPASELKCDGLNHWPEMCSNKNRCRYCKNGYSRVKCTKCNLMLCLNSERNCFVQFHLK